MADDPNLALPLGDSDFQRQCKDLLRSGEISSDGELGDVARQELSKQTNDVNAASEMVRMNVTTWIKKEPSLLILHRENPTTLFILSVL